jgi:catechol 2,3-dioxygenase-like lactoylglutathione lyase family enzyme
MIDHVSLSVRDVKKSKRFYAEALVPLGYRVVAEFPGGAGLGSGPKADLWLSRRDPVTAHVHVAFLCGTRSLVDAFYAAAIRAGGRDNGAPGPRAEYHPHYYGAFVLDPDGHNIEAVCHEPALPAKREKPGRNSRR